MFRMDERQVGQNIRALRVGQGLSLTAVAAKAGLSKGTLSKIETAQISPPISTLLPVAKALGVHLSRFFSEPEASRSWVVTRKGRAPLISPRGEECGYVYRALAVDMPGKDIAPFLLTVRPADKSVVFRHDGQEFIYMLSGRMRMTLGDVEVVLSEGDALYFDPSQEHVCKALDRRAAQFLCVFTQPPCAGSPS